MRKIFGVEWSHTQFWLRDLQEIWQILGPAGPENFAEIDLDVVDFQTKNQARIRPFQVLSLEGHGDVVRSESALSNGGRRQVKNNFRCFFLST